VPEKVFSGNYKATSRKEKIMKKYIVQYSRPGKAIACSDWTEYTTKLMAENAKEAIRKFNKNRDGTWMILDCYPDEN